VGGADERAGGGTAVPVRAGASVGACVACTGACVEAEGPRRAVRRGFPASLTFDSDCTEGGFNVREGRCQILSSLRVVIPMKITNAAHLDHALTSEHVALILDLFGNRTRFFLETVALPEALGALPCGLHGPVMGDAPVPEAECSYAVRGSRAGASRLCMRPARLVRTMTVIGGPDGEEPCVLYTAFGGPAAPREPWDPSLATDASAGAASRAFWSEHALSAE
jgi:hypothetical protein